MTIGRPQPGDYAQFYQPYLDVSASHTDAHALLAGQRDVLARMAAWPADRASHRYAEGKWSVAEVVGHMADTERVFAYRLLRIARADATPLSGFDENAWQLQAGFQSRALASVVAELTAVRQASTALVESLDAAAIEREGLANGKRVTARALAWLIGGHFAHHAAILRDRYGMP